MSCASCATTVENTLKKQPGVVSAAVNYADNSAALEFSSNATSPEALRNAVQSVGYDLVTEPDASGNTEDDAVARHLSALKRNTFLAILLTIPVVIYGMFLMHAPYANEIMWLFSTPVLFLFGRQFFVIAWKQARHGRANMDTLVALSTGIAYLFSVFNLLYPEFWTSRGLEAHVYFEAAAVIISFILLGRLLEERAKSGASQAIRKLMGLQPDTVTLILEDGNERTIPIAEVFVGDVLVVKPGDKVPVDGEVISGSSYVDESMISGEPVAVAKETGASVFAGTINQKGSFRLRAEKVGSQTVLAQIVEMVRRARGSKAPVQKLVDRIAGIFVPVVMAVSVLSMVVWSVSGVDNAFTQGLLAMVTVLIIACPCALGLATPTAIMVGVGKSAEAGILIKDAGSLEITRKITAVVLDKTGTITEGRPEVTHVEWATDVMGNSDVMQHLSGVLVMGERQSEHPLAEAVVRHFSSLSGDEMPESEGFLSLTGKGIMVRAGGTMYRIGNKKLIEENKLQIADSFLEIQTRLEAEARTLIWFADQDRVLALVGVSDPIKEGSKNAIVQLQQQGIEVHLLTGDTLNTAAAVARTVGIDHVEAGVLPAQKAAYVDRLKAAGHIVAMVGDGINDSQALAHADVSIAMGHGSDIAMDVATMTIISSDLRKIPTAIRLSGATVKTIRQNLFWAFIYNILGIPIAAGVLYPFTGFLLNPMIAGAAMALSSVSVVLNSLRLRRRRGVKNIRSWVQKH